MGTLLIVEDDPLLLAGMEELLGAYGHQVIGVTSGRAALEVLKESAVDLIISDVAMPEMSGLELLRAVREYPGASRISFLFVSGNPLLELEQNAATLPNVFYMPKPFQIDALLRTVAAALDAYGT